MAAPASYLAPSQRRSYQGVLRSEAAQRPNFRGYIFPEPIDLQGVTFPEGLVFSCCEFQKEVSFKGAHFLGMARFYKCIFREPVDFTWAAVELKEDGQPGACDNGEANFSWSRFESNVDFYGARFHGPVWFWRTMFRNALKFEGVRSDDAVTFESSPAQVCLEALDFPDKQAFFDLHKAGLLWPDKDDTFCANMPGMASTDVLRQRLTGLGWPSRKLEQVVSVYSEWSGNLFSEKEGASFQRAYFEKPEQVQFSNVDLKTCQFKNCNVARVKFQNVRWDRQHTVLLASRRSAVCDERTASTAENLRAVGRVYYDLRLNYEQARLFEEASDFNYGEAEMQRRCQPPPLQYISLAAFYRYLSGYGERAGLALFWLVAAIFLFFPLLYMHTGYIHEFFRAVLYSLETSTFLEASKDTKETVPILAKFVTGFERIAVPVQAGMFALAVQRKFARK